MNDFTVATPRCISFPPSTDVPPLEDMEEVLKVTTRGSSCSARTSQPTHPTIIGQDEGNRGHKSDKGAKNFGGLKKGFLSAKPKSNSNVNGCTVMPDRPPQCPPENDMPHLRKKPANVSSLELPEVQEAMKNATPLLASRG